MRACMTVGRRIVNEEMAIVVYSAERGMSSRPFPSVLVGLPGKRRGMTRRACMPRRLGRKYGVSVRLGE